MIIFHRFRDCNFVYDNTLDICDMSLNVLVDKLESSTETRIKWFEYNYITLNESKCKLLISGSNENVVIASLVKISESHNITLLGTHVYREFKFNDHVNNKYKTAGKSSML